MTQEHDRQTVQLLQLLLQPIRRRRHHRCGHYHCARRLNGGGGVLAVEPLTVRIAPTGPDAPTL